MFKLIAHMHLRAHEHIDQCHVQRLLKQIEKDGFIDDPVVIDLYTMIILDGHHRCAVARLLGLTKIPAYFVNYRCAQITVDSWRAGECVTKAMVLQAGLSGNLLEVKTSRHHIEPRPRGLKISLEILK